MSSGGAAWLRAGRVGSPHGLDGSFHVSEPRPQLLDVGAVVSVDGRALEITRRAGTERRVIVRLAGYEDRDAAESLRGSELLVARGDAPELGPDEWWAEELEGCSVVDGGRRVGRVRRLLALPSCEVLEVELEAAGELMLIPLVADAVRGVDIERREIEVELKFVRTEA